MVCELHVSSARIIDAVCEQTNACDKQNNLHAMQEYLLSLCTHLVCMHLTRQLTAHVCSVIAFVYMLLLLTVVIVL